MSDSIFLAVSSLNTLSESSSDVGATGSLVHAHGFPPAEKGFKPQMRRKEVSGKERLFRHRSCSAASSSCSFSSSSGIDVYLEVPSGRVAVLGMRGPADARRRAWSARASRRSISSRISATDSDSLTSSNSAPRASILSCWVILVSLVTRSRSRRSLKPNTSPTPAP